MKAEKANFKLREAEYEIVISGMYPGVIKVSSEVLKETAL